MLIYLALHQRIVAYEKAHGRSVWKDFAGEKEDADRLRAEYRAWRMRQGPEEMAAAADTIRQHDVVTARRLALRRDELSKLRPIRR